MIDTRKNMQQKNKRTAVGSSGWCLHMWVQVFVLGWNLKQTVAPFNEILLESGVE